MSATGAGALDGLGVAVKDLFAVRGHAVGGGVPSFLSGHAVEAANAAAVAQLLTAGAHVTGIAHTDELAFGLEGVNPHYGTPPNTAAPDRLPGGSSSGPASAVGLGDADIGLVTDTAGSARVPASFQGLWGLRSATGSVDMRGMTPLAPSFDAVGWIARTPDTIDRILGLSASVATRTSAMPIVATDLVELADDAVSAEFRAVTAGFEADPVRVGRDRFEAWFTAFRLLQAFEAWATHGAWISRNPGALSPTAERRFRAGAAVPIDAVATARDVVRTARERIRELIGDRVLLLPTTGTPPPPRDVLAGALDAARGRTLRLAAVAAIAGLPALTAPLLTVGGLPVGITYVAAPGGERAILHAAASREAAERGRS